MTSARSEPPVVFLDRDGTLNRKAPEGEYIRNWEEFDWLPGALTALRLLTAGGCRIVVVTNQRGVALGRMSEAEVADIHRRMRAEAAAHGGRIERVYHCPHEIGTCACRKPADGMLRRARDELALGTLAKAAIVGDSITDVQAGRALGLLTVLLREAGAEPLPAQADHLAPSLIDAAAWLLGRWYPPAENAYAR